MSHLVFVESTSVGVRALAVARELGHRVTFVTSHGVDWLLTDTDLAALQRDANLFLEVSDTRDVDVLVDALRRAGEPAKADAVLTTLQQFVEPAAAAAARLGIRATSASGIHSARNKGLCRDILRKHGIPSVRYRVVETLAQALEALEEIGYPAVIKPITGMGKVLTTIAHGESDLRTHFAEAARSFELLRAGIREEISLQFIVEELVIGEMYSLELGVSAHGEYIPFALMARKVGRHNPVLEIGSTLPCGLSPAQCAEVEEYGVRVVKALGLDLGIFHIEIIYTREGPRLVEVNPRLCGALLPELIRRSTGGDMLEYLIRVYLGERIGIDSLPCVTAVSSMNIAAFEACVVREDLPEDWWRRYETHWLVRSPKLAAGQELRRMISNYDNYGVVLATGDERDEVFEQAERLRTQIQRDIGVRLVEAAAPAPRL